MSLSFAQQRHFSNNFDGVRIGLALIVVFAHLAELSGSPSFRMFGMLFDANFAVKGFFAISGFLVTKSYYSSKTIWDYAEKRARRIVPAYITAVLLCALIGAVTTTISIQDFLLSKETLKYIVANAIFLNFLQPTLPGVFENNPVQAMNGSLWTIKVEVMLYFCVPIIVFLYSRFDKRMVSAIIFFLSIAYSYFFLFRFDHALGAEISRQFPGQLAFFVFGSFCAVFDGFRRRLGYIATGSLLFIFVLNDPVARLIIDPVAYSSIVIFLATAPIKDLNLGRYGDLSYGIYLYHFPIVQLLTNYNVFEKSPWIGAGATLSLTVLASLISWHFIEKRLLKRNSHYLQASRAEN